jgi:hypothetical protein
MQIIGLKIFSLTIRLKIKYLLDKNNDKKGVIFELFFDKIETNLNGLKFNTFSFEIN